MKSQKIVVDNKTYEVVATIHDDDTNKDFVIYTDEALDKNKGLTISCVLYHEENGEFIPEKIMEEEDKETAKELIQEVLEKLYKVTTKK